MFETILISALPSITAVVLAILNHVGNKNLVNGEIKSTRKVNSSLATNLESMSKAQNDAIKALNDRLDEVEKELALREISAEALKLATEEMKAENERLKEIIKLLTTEKQQLRAQLHGEE